jgi:hypothetical protein
VNRPAPAAVITPGPAAGAAARAGSRSATVAAIETCRLIASKEFAEKADKAFGSSGHLARLQERVEQTSAVPWFRDLARLEQKASEIREYDSYVISGLLQTERYAEQCVNPTRPEPTLDEHLAMMSERPGIVITIIPSNEGSTAACGRSFTILTFKAETPVVYLEDIKSARNVRKTDEVAIYNLTFEHLRSRALTDVKSRALIREAIRHYAE